MCCSDENNFSPLTELDWNFDTVPDDELIACCYWEYARESAFIRSVRQRCLDPQLRNMLNLEFQSYVGYDTEKIRSIGPQSDVFLQGVCRPPSDDLSAIPHLNPGDPPPTGNFPDPWQRLPVPDRCARSQISSECHGCVPFQQGKTLDAENILDCARMQRSQAEADRQEVRQQHPELTEGALLESGKLKFPNVRVAVFHEWGREASIVAIEWGCFTNDEIVNYFRRWVKVNRPAQFSGPNSQGHKLKDWRAHLTRLSVLRLLARFTVSELIDRLPMDCPATWNTKAFSGQKWLEANKWYDARREAGKLFHQMFPFLPADDQPLSWGRQKPAG